MFNSSHISEMNPLSALKLAFSECRGTPFTPVALPRKSGAGPGQENFPGPLSLPSRPAATARPTHGGRCQTVVGRGPTAGSRAIRTHTGRDLRIVPQRVLLSESLWLPRNWRYGWEILRSCRRELLPETGSTPSKQSSALRESSLPPQKFSLPPLESRRALRA
jgi:hypothetical protein